MTGTSSFDVNSRSARWSAILFGVIGTQVFIVQPGFVQGLVEVSGYSEREAGFVAAAEMAGIALTASAMTILAALLNWRLSLAMCCLLAIAGNLISAVLTEPTGLATAHFVAGLGLGGLISLSFAAVGLTRKPDREFALYLAWVLIYGAAGLFAMPVLLRTVGMAGFLCMMAALAAIGLPFIRFFAPSGASRAEPNPDAIDMPRLYKASALLGVLAYNIALGVAWAYLFLIGTQAGIPDQHVANALAASQVFAIGGALTAFFLGNRIGRTLPLSVGILGGALGLVPLTGRFALATYAASVIAFNYLWNVALPYLLAAMANYDLRGLMVVRAIALQMIGLGVAPAVAAAVVAPGNFDQVILVSVVFFVLSLVLTAIPLLRHAALRNRAQ